MEQIIKKIYRAKGLFTSTIYEGELVVDDRQIIRMKYLHSETQYIKGKYVLDECENEVAIDCTTITEITK